MTTAFLLAWPFLAALVVLGPGWLIRRQRRAHSRQVASLLDHIARQHPAGISLPDVGPFKGRSECGHLIFGDSLGDLMVNEVFHAQQCPHHDARRQAS